MVTSGVRDLLLAVGPGGGFVVVGLCSEVAGAVAGEPVPEGAQGLMVAEAIDALDAE